MTSETRLKLCGTIVVLSSLYAILIAKDPSIASAVATGYVGIVLTIIVLNHVWRKP